MYWSQTESSKWSPDNLFNDLGRPFIVMYRKIRFGACIEYMYRGRGRYTPSESAKYMKYMHDTRAKEMEEGHDTIHAKERAIHDDTHGGKSAP